MSDQRYIPTPYRVVCFNLNTFQINGTGEHELTEIADVREFTDGTDEANARFIVRACNSHDEMLDALKAMDALVENLWGAVSWGGSFGLDIEALNKAPLLAKRAIAKAEGTEEQ